MEVATRKTAFPTYSEYKESGEYWMGDIPEHWDLKKLKHVFQEKKKVTNPSLNCGSISFGKVVYKDDEKVPESTKASYQEVLAGEYLVNPLNLNYDLISLRIGLSDINVVVSSGYIVLKNVLDIDKSYFNYLLHRYDVAYMKLLGSGVRQTISFNHIANSLLAYPPKEEQTAIAAFLDEKTAKIDRAIAQKEQLIALLKERKQIIIQNAVTGKVVWSEKEQKMIPLAQSNVKAKDSGVEWIGEIPEHWELCKLGHFATINNGATPSRANLRYWTNGTLGWLSSGKVNESVVKEPSEYITERAVTDCSLKVFPKLTVIMGIVGQGKTRGTSSMLEIEATINQNMVGIITKNKLSPFFLHFFLIQGYHSIRNGNGSNQEALNCDIIKNLKLPVPNKLEQMDVVEHIKTQSAKIDQAISLQKTQIEKLKEYKSSLIDSAVTGKIKVTEL